MLQRSFLFFLAFLLFSCDREDERKEILFRVYIDNPSSKKYTIFINGQKNNVKPSNTEILELEKGRYHFKAFDEKGKEIFEKNINVDTNILVNISLCNYYLVNEIYSTNKEIYKTIALDTLEISGQTLIGLFAKLPEGKYFYKQEWQFFTEEDLPAQMPYKGKYGLYSKLVREKDLINFYYQE